MSEAQRPWSKNITIGLYDLLRDVPSAEGEELHHGKLLMLRARNNCSFIYIKNVQHVTRFAAQLIFKMLKTF